ncbi:hypothetical protein AB0M20_21720 [Actinoplanes sp. NPDC051633]|uniref:hypothetical protein n=1 Tax=Actinoplanes sp. NPDC051633 TaxID=3155670 RepID=UPI0034386E14
MIRPPHIPGLHKRTAGFDFLVGDWLVDNRRLRTPLAGKDDWYTTPATATASTLHNGAISIDEMWFPELGFAGSSIRVHEAATGDWTIYWVSSGTGHLQPPVRGRWREDGTFVADGPDTFDGRDIIARYMWHSITPTSAVWEQAFSVDDRESWETNWVMSWTRAAAA